MVLKSDLRVTLLSGAAAMMLGSAPVLAEDEKITMIMGWRAQAEQGGFWNASLKGYYAECGVEMDMRQGGAGIDVTRLLTSNAVDAAITSQNDGVMRMREAGFPAVAVFTSFQHTPTTIDVHEESGIDSFEELVGHPIFLSSGNRNTFWPYLQMKYGYADNQLRSFSGQFAAFLANPESATQDFVTNGPYVMQQEAPDVKVRHMFLRDTGYMPYSGLLTVSEQMIEDKPEVVQCLVDASRRGWVDYLADPSDAFAYIAEIAPENSMGLLDYAFTTMKEFGFLENEDTASYGYGAMTNARWKIHYEQLVATGTFPEGFDYTAAYTLDYQNGSD
ncbi:MAG: ABC transporter substrate-binding protein [Qingshengfaniella sp.]